jgi:hypothetical protein
MEDTPAERRLDVDAEQADETTDAVVNFESSSSEGANAAMATVG